MEEQWWLLFETEFDALSYDLQRYLYDSFFQFAYKEIIYLLKDHTLAEDIIQEAFLKATAKRHQLKNAASGKQWVRRIIRNQMLDSIKSKKNRHWTNLEDVYKVNVKDTSTLEAAASIENNVEDALRNQMLHEAIMELKEEYRTLLIKYYMEEKPYKEIALELGISEQVIAQRLFRARKKLLGQFSKKWGDNDGE